jgi:hypothetical protein
MKPEKSREQELIDILFQIAILTKEHKGLQKMDREEYGKWARHQLRECGFDTFPCGSSWAVLNRPGDPPVEVYEPPKPKDEWKVDEDAPALVQWFQRFKLFKT